MKLLKDALDKEAYKDLIEGMKEQLEVELEDMQTVPARWERHIILGKQLVKQLNDIVEKTK